MGESVAEATITTWLKNVGDFIEADDVLLEIATDKVDSDVPSEVSGILREQCFEEGEVVKVGEVIAIIDVEGEANNDPEAKEEEPKIKESALAIEEEIERVAAENQILTPSVNTAGRFYSPLVRNIAQAEGVSSLELDSIKGTGAGERVTKNDILQFIAKKKPVTPSDSGISHLKKQVESVAKIKISETNVATPSSKMVAPIVSGEDEVIEMSRMGKLISDHMTASLSTSAHVQSFIEADVTNIWNWRENAKKDFLRRQGEKLTFTPIFMEVIAQALREYPLMNISVDGNKIIKKKDINLGMATALPDGNLIVPVIKNADQLNLVGLAQKVNDLANRARNNNLKPDDIKDGTYTVTNIGSFGTIMGTPIINQPQVGILALGAIRKVPAVIETPEGDFIGIRKRMFLSHSYDHRVVNGALGGMFVQRVKELLESWDINRAV